MTSSTSQDNVCEACEYDKNLELLRALPLFSGLPLESQRAYAYLCRRVRYQQDSVLFHQDDMDNKAYIVVSGALHLFRNDGEGEYTCGGVTEGRFFGALALMADVRRLFTARAAVPTVCLVLPRKKLLTDLIQKPEIAAQFMKGVTDRIITWEEKRLQRAECATVPETDITISLI